VTGVNGLPTNTLVQNQGSITFDGNAPDNTPVWINTVDNTPPASQVVNLGSMNQTTASFPVQWQVVGGATDVQSFIISYRDNGGPLHSQQMTSLGGTFPDMYQPGDRPPVDHQPHTFAFYSQAQDMVGNLEAMHSSADWTTTSVAAVEDAGALQLALEGARPNPSVGGIRAYFTLPNEERATLDLMDVAGRRVARREVGELGPGRHSLDLGVSPRLHAGLYFLRLAQGGRVLHARVALIR